jgi:dolichyl-phosphate beta-glucosyltransferase
MRGPGNPVPQRSLSLVVPVFNEVDRFAERSDELLEFVGSLAPGSQLLFVDDGSTDETGELIEKMIASDTHVDVRLLREPHQGKGAALRAGLLESTGEYGGFCDVDLATPLVDLARVVAVAEETGGLAIGSRGIAGSELVAREPLPREILGRVYNAFLRATVIDGVRDTQCGAKAAPTVVWRRILTPSREIGFAWDAEIVAIAQRIGIRVDEVPITWRHDDRTTVRTLRDGFDLLQAIPRIRRVIHGL